MRWLLSWLFMICCLPGCKNGTTDVLYDFYRLPDSSQDDLREKRRVFRELLQVPMTQDRMFDWFGRRFRLDRKKYGIFLYDVAPMMKGKDKEMLVRLLGYPDYSDKNEEGHLLIWTWREPVCTVVFSFVIVEGKIRDIHVAD